jgi:hypothetical protein
MWYHHNAFTLPAATDRLGVAQTALALARVLYNPRAVSSQQAAAKELAALLDKLRRRRRAVVVGIWRWCGRWLRRVAPVENANPIGSATA